jgi:hypothetical protein
LHSDRQTDGGQFACVVLVGFLVFSPLRFQVDINISPEALHTFLANRGYGEWAWSFFSAALFDTSPFTGTGKFLWEASEFSPFHFNNYKRGRGISLHWRLS